MKKSKINQFAERIKAGIKPHNNPFVLAKIYNYYDDSKIKAIKDESGEWPTNSAAYSFPMGPMTEAQAKEEATLLAFMGEKDER